MFSTLLMQLRVMLRQPSGLFWALMFPLLLGTMFNGMFNNLDKVYTVQTVQVAVVEDNAFCTSDTARALIQGLQKSKKSVALCTNTEQQASATYESAQYSAEGFLEVTPVKTVEEGDNLLKDKHKNIDAMITVNDDHMLTLALSGPTALAIQDATNTSGESITVNILHTILQNVNRQTMTIEDILDKNPQELANLQTNAAESTESSSMSRSIELTHFKPSETAPYYFALLAMASLSAMAFAVTSVTSAQANLSEVGLRRSVSALPKWRQLFGGFLASWLLCSVMLVIALVYIRYVLGISMGGRDLLAALACIIASFTSCALGTLLGAIPKLTEGAKIGISIAITCTLSLFTGLYGGGAMQLSVAINRHAPFFALINPAQQITNLFYDIVYYDSLTPFVQTIGILAVMSCIFLAGSTVILRRQRYEHL